MKDTDVVFSAIIKQVINNYKYRTKQTIIFDCKSSHNVDLLRVHIQETRTSWGSIVQHMKHLYFLTSTCCYNVSAAPTCVFVGCLSDFIKWQPSCVLVSYHYSLPSETWPAHSFFHVSVGVSHPNTSTTDTLYYIYSDSWFIHLLHVSGFHEIPYFIYIAPNHNSSYLRSLFMQNNSDLYKFTETREDPRERALEEDEELSTRTSSNRDRS